MDVRFTDDEIAEALTVLVNRMADEAGLPDKDRAMLKRWRTARMKLGSDGMQELVDKTNEDFAQMMVRRERSQIQKHDWNDSRRCVGRRPLHFRRLPVDLSFVNKSVSIPAPRGCSHVRLVHLRIR